ncbi:MAG: hypothetical protein IH603_05410 [Burkholderia vietnamiensis]|nr:hypothetical protein [Burkholderia vietnamiensis]
MAISDAQFQEWLFRDNQRCLLGEAKAYTGAVEETVYYSNRGFPSKPSDTPPNQPYDDILVPNFTLTFSSKLSELFTGRSIPDWGGVLFTNENGARDAWLGYGWDGRAHKMYIGDLKWRKADFRLILDGVTADIGSPQRDRLNLKISDKTWMLNVPVQTTLMTGSDANVDQPQPICVGPCFNIEGVLENAATYTYRFHDGQIEDVTAARDSGIPVAFTKDLANGRASLTAAPSGRVTWDVKGAKPGGVYLTKCADIVQYLVTAHSQLTTADIDAANFTAFNTTCPQTLNKYIRDRENLIDVLDPLVTSVGGFWTFSRGGLLQLGRLDATTGSATIALTADDIREKMLSITARDLPIATLRLSYQKNWTVQTDGLAGAVSTANRALYGAPYMVSKYSDPSLFTAHKLAREPDVRETLLAFKSDADTEVARLQALFGVVRTRYKASGYMAPLTLSLGDEISLDHPRFGFAGGGTAIVVGFEEEITKNRVTLHLWK